MLLVALLVLAVEQAPPPPSTDPVQPKGRVTTPLMEAQRAALSVAASSSWPGWEPHRLIDGDPLTSWFSAKGDSAAHGKKPWVELRFAGDVVVTKVTLLGNREPSWPKGFTIHYGVIEVRDAQGRLLATAKNEGKNVAADVDFRFKAPVSGVRSVRFTSLLDEGKQTAYEDIALGEMLVE